MFLQSLLEEYLPTWHSLHVFSCQFVIKEGGDYAVNCVNPDVIVDWDLIKQVVGWK